MPWRLCCPRGRCSAYGASPLFSPDRPLASAASRVVPRPSLTFQPGSGRFLPQGPGVATFSPPSSLKPPGDEGALHTPPRYPGFS